MRINLLVLGILLSTFSLHAQQPASFILTGKITNAATQPLSRLTVSADNGPALTTSGMDGSYQLRLAQGKHLLFFYALGYQKQESPVHITADGQKHLNVQLVEAKDALQSVEVIGRKESGYKNEISFSGTKTATSIKETP